MIIITSSGSRGSGLAGPEHRRVPDPEHRVVIGLFERSARNGGGGGGPRLLRSALQREAEGAQGGGRA